MSFKCDICKREIQPGEIIVEAKVIIYSQVEASGESLNILNNDISYGNLSDLFLNLCDKCWNVKGIIESNPPNKDNA